MLIFHGLRHNVMQFTSYVIGEYQSVAHVSYDSDHFRSVRLNYIITNINCPVTINCGKKNLTYVIRLILSRTLKTTD